MLLTLTDKKGKKLYQDDVIWDGEHYYTIWINRENSHEMFSCSTGYKHDIRQKDLENFIRIGSFKENKHLLSCD